LGSTPAFRFAHKARNSRVEFRTLNIYDLSPDAVGTFDVVLCLGVVYHLEYPLLGIQRTLAVTRHLALFESARESEPMVSNRPYWSFLPGFAGDPTNFFFPTPEGLRRALVHVGFAPVELVSVNDARMAMRGCKAPEAISAVYRRETRRVISFPGAASPPAPSPAPAPTSPPDLPGATRRIQHLVTSVLAKARTVLEQRLRPANGGAHAPSVAWVPPPPRRPAPPVDDFDPETLPWIDRANADIDGYVRGLTALPSGYDLRAQLHRWRELGYVVFPNAVPHGLIDAYLADVEGAMRRHQELRTLVTHEVRGNVELRELTPADLKSPHYRLCDFHNSSVAGKHLALNPTAVSFLSHAFGDRVVAMQSLTFFESSEQTTHQDYAYVVARIPSHLAGCWMALEDVHPDAGPLAYYPGSHRIGPKFNFGNGLLLTAGSRHDEHDFARYIEEQCRLKDIRRQVFMPKKGDLFIWHAALAHAGSEVRDRARTRKSFVSHCSSLTAYPEDRRAPGPPRVFELNGGLVYGNPRLPDEEDAFPLRGEPG
jgi:ectoine hydroxylase-related dioxygenase (phytanoyl-CoA dioxygenase family)